MVVVIWINAIGIEAKAEAFFLLLLRRVSPLLSLIYGLLYTCVCKWTNACDPLSSPWCWRCTPMYWNAFTTASVIPRRPFHRPSCYFWKSSSLLYVFFFLKIPLLLVVGPYATPTVLLIIVLLRPSACITGGIFFFRSGCWCFGTLRFDWYRDFVLFL